MEEGENKGGKGEEEREGGLVSGKGERREKVWGGGRGEMARGREREKQEGRDLGFWEREEEEGREEGGSERGRERGRERGKKGEWGVGRGEGKGQWGVGGVWEGGWERRGEGGKAPLTFTLAEETGPGVAGNAEDCFPALGLWGPWAAGTGIPSDRLTAS